MKIEGHILNSEQNKQEEPSIYRYTILIIHPK